MSFVRCAPSFFARPPLLVVLPYLSIPYPFYPLPIQALGRRLHRVNDLVLLTLGQFREDR